MNADELRRRWDERAADDARFHIRADRTDWTDEAFLASGEADVARFADPALALLAGREVALDLGCGLGRLSRALASRFDRVEAVDISPEMVQRAQELAPPPPGNVRFLLCPGDGTLPLDDGSVDFAFSYLVFQHLPGTQLVRSYVGDLARVLRPGGVGRIQLNGRRRPLRERLSVGVVASDRVPAVHRKLRCKVDPHDHMGAVVTSAQARRMADAAGLDLLSLDGEGTTAQWLTLRR